MNTNVGPLGFMAMPTASSEGVRSPSREEKPGNALDIAPRVKEAMKSYRQELATYVRELPRLLQTGNAGRYVVLQGENTYGVWDTHHDAVQYAAERFPYGVLFLAQLIDERLLASFQSFLAESQR